MATPINRSLLAALMLSLAVPGFAQIQPKQSVSLQIDKMFCVACGISVKKALNKVQGVEDVRVDVDQKTATVRFDPNRATVEDLIQATSKAGFPSVNKSKP